MFNNSKRIKELERQNDNIYSHLKESQRAVREKNTIIEEKDREIIKLKSIIVQTAIDKHKDDDKTRTIRLPILDDPYEFLIRSDNCEPKYFCDDNTDGKERYFVHFSRHKVNEKFDEEMRLYGKSKPLLNKSVYKGFGNDIQGMIDRGLEELKKVPNEI